MSLRNFNKNFGISPTIEEEKRAFINRSIHFFESLKEFMDSNEPSAYQNLFQTFCTQLGLNPQKVIKENRGFL